MVVISIRGKGEGVFKSYLKRLCYYHSMELFSEVFNDKENDEEFHDFVPEDLLSSSDDEDDENPIDFLENWQCIDWPRTDIGFIRVLGLNLNLEDQRSPLDY